MKHQPIASVSSLWKRFEESRQRLREECVNLGRAEPNRKQAIYTEYHGREMALERKHYADLFAYLFRIPAAPGKLPAAANLLSPVPGQAQPTKAIAL